MEKKDFEQFISDIKKEVREEISKTVNGKIDDLKKQMTDHEDKLKPILEVYDTANNIGRFAKWTSGILLSFAVIWGFVWSFLKTFHG